MYLKYIIRGGAIMLERKFYNVLLEWKNKKKQSYCVI